MKILDGKFISSQIKNELKNKVEDLMKKGIKPGLGIILVGNRKDSETYVRMKKKSCNEVGIVNYDIHLNENESEEKIIEEVNKMNNNDNIHGILVQLPLPNHINEKRVIKCVNLEKKKELQKKNTYH